MSGSEFWKKNGSGNPEQSLLHEKFCEDGLGNDLKAQLQRQPNKTSILKLRGLERNTLYG